MTFDVPILFLVFNRPDTTARVFEKIRKIKPQKLFIAADGPRDGKEGEKEKCEEVRKLIIDGVDWDCEVKTLFREKNLGSGNAVSGAINWLFEHVDRGIILEDDILCSDSFFTFCKELLIRYQDDESIMQISGANCTYPFYKTSDSYYFSKIIHGWGWATWSRAWKKFKFTLQDIDENDLRKKLEAYFSDERIVSYLMTMYANVKDGPSDIWDYQWLFRVIYLDGLSITPSKSLTINVGFAGDATHTVDTPDWYKHVELADLEGKLEHPLSKTTFKEADLFFSKQFTGTPVTFPQRVIRYIKRRILG